ncbi:hypothetical protein [Streptomyces sp. NPDC002067]
MSSAKHGQGEHVGNDPYQQPGQQPEEPMPRMNVGWAYRGDPHKALDPDLNHTQRVLTVRVHNSTRAFVQSLIFGAVLLFFGIAYRKLDAALAAVGALAGVGTLAFGVRSLVKSIRFRRELRRVTPDS